MGSAVRMVTVYRGLDPRHYLLKAFGGAGPLHAVRVAAEFGIPRVLVPVLPGVRSAVGLLESDVSYDFVKAAQTPAAAPDLALLERSFAELEERARGYSSVAELTLRRSLEIRFAHQQVRLRIGIPSTPIDAALVAEAEARFRQSYFVQCGINPVDHCVVLNCWIDAWADVAKPAAARSTTGAAAGTALRGERRAYFPETGFVATPVYDREKLSQDAAIPGPALLEDPESTVVLPPGYSAALDRFGNLMIEKSG